MLRPIVTGYKNGPGRSMLRPYRKNGPIRKPDGAALLLSLVTRHCPYKTTNSSLLKVMCFSPFVETRKVFSMPTAPRPG